MKLTDATTIIGCLISLVTLIFLIKNELRNRHKLEISLMDPSYFFLKNNHHPKFESKYQAILSVRILNKSPLPITIYDLNAKTPHKKLTLSPYNDNKMNLKVTFLSGESLSALLKTPNQKFELPVTIQPFSVYQTHVFVSSFINENKPRETIEFEVSTTTKTFKNSFQVKRFPGSVKSATK